jgi:bacillithiol system protein YtxJ
VISLPGNSLLLVPSTICYANFMMVELHEEQDLEPLLERSQKRPVVLFKHSTQCGRSAAAHHEVQAFAKRHPDIPCGIVNVIEDRDLSDAMEERFGIEHESPQAIVLAHGKPVWHASHYRVTVHALEDAIGTRKA